MVRREYPDQPVVGVGAVIIDNGKILLVKRAQPPGENLWSIPGGVVKLGEKLKEALKREVKEETGLEIEVKDLVDVFEVIEKDKDGRIRFHYVIVDYECRVIGGELKAASDALNAKWFSKGDLPKIKTTRTTRLLIHKMLREGRIR